MSEQAAEEAAALAMTSLAPTAVPAAVPALAMTIVVILPIAGSGLCIPCRRLLDRRWRRNTLVGGIAFNDFVEFAAIEPDAPTLRTIVDFDTLTVGKQEVHATRRAKQPRCLPRGSIR